MSKQQRVTAIFWALCLSWSVLTIALVFFHQLNLADLVANVATIKSITSSYREYVAFDYLQHAVIWLVGTVGLFFTHRYMLGYERGSEKNLAELSESEKKFRTLFDNAPSGIAMVDLSGRFLSINDEYLLIVGRTREQMIGMNFNEITFAGDGGISETFLRKIENGEERCVYEKRYVRINNEVVWVKVSACGLKNDLGEICSFIVVVDNIQANKLQEEELRRKTHMLKEVQHIAKLGSWEYNLVTQESYCSTELRQIFECPGLRSSCGYQQIVNHIHPEDRDDFDWGFQLTITSGMDCEQSLRLLMPDGRVKHIHQRSLSYRNENGDVIKIISAVMDVTALKRSEDGLILAHKMESIGTLAGGIAHDFNNILSIILGNANMIHVSPGKINLVEGCAANIERAVETAAGIARQLLTFTSSDSPVKKILNLHEFIGGAVKLSLHGSAVISKFEFASDDLIAEFDKDQMTQVFSNLVINAIQAMPEGGQIAVKTSCQEIGETNDFSLKVGKYARIEVSDNGIGIDKENLNRVFEPYFTTKEIGAGVGGVGIGLFAVYSIIKKHEGCISVQSVKGEGTTFVIYLPLADKQVSVKGVMQDSGVTKSHQYSVMVMDDDPLVGRVVCMLLNTLGYEATLTPNGEAMLEAYYEAINAGKHYDVYLMDLTVPGGMGGKATVAKLLEIDPDAKAIVYSGYNDEMTMAAYQEHGFIGCLHKPISMTQLKKAIEAAIELSLK